MTKAELIDQVAAEAELTKAKAQKAIEALLEAVTKTLKQEGRIALFGLGVFEVTKRPQRQGHDPRTGQPLTIKAHQAVKFRAAQAVKDFLN